MNERTNGLHDTLSLPLALPLPLPRRRRSSINSLCPRWCATARCGAAAARLMYCLAVAGDLGGRERVLLLPKLCTVLNSSLCLALPFGHSAIRLPLPLFLPAHIIRGQDGRSRSPPYPAHLPIAISQPWNWVFMRSLCVFSNLCTSSRSGDQSTRSLLRFLSLLLADCFARQSASSHYPIVPDQMPFPIELHSDDLKL